MNFFDVKAVGDLLSDLSGMCGNAVMINNAKLNTATLKAASEIADAVSNSVVELLTCTRFADLFGQILYDCIVVERQDENQYQARFETKLNGKDYSYIGYGETFEDARTNLIVYNLCSWLDIVSVRQKKEEAKENANTVKLNIKFDNAASDTDENMFQATKTCNGCDGHCEDCTHEE